MPVNEGIIYSIIDSYAYVGDNEKNLEDHNALDSNNINAKTITILSHIDGFPVLTIGSYAFRYSSIEYVKIPKTVEIMELDCFAYITTLHTVIFELESHLKEMKQGVFHLSSNIERIILPASLNTIEKYAFGHSGLKYIYYYGQSEMTNDKIFAYDSPVKRDLPSKVYFCRNSQFNHFGEFNEAEKIEKVLDCPVDSMNCYSCNPKSIIISFHVCFITSIFINIKL